jgi:hypothetical protein
MEQHGADPGHGGPARHERDQEGVRRLQTCPGTLCQVSNSTARQSLCPRLISQYRNRYI